MTSALDPEFEQLHAQHREVSAHAPDRRERRVEYTAGLLLVATSLAMLLVNGGGVDVDWAVLLPLMAVYVLFYQVVIAVGPASTTPLQVVVVPMWFALEPALLPLAVAASGIAGQLVAGARAPEHLQWRRALIAVPDAWYAVGPAAVLLTVAHSGAPTVGDWPIYMLALGAQFFFDGVTGMLRSYTAGGLPPAQAVRPMLWMWSVDAALAPIGLLLAVAIPQSPWVIISILPIGVLAMLFARERDDRIEHAMELSSAYRGTAQLMGDVLEADDAYTGGEHTQGVVELSLAVGRQLGLAPARMRKLEFGALLHDIGKLRVPNEIINKPGKLNDEEWAIIKQHPGYGQEMLDQVGGALSEAGEVVRAHHERWDGNGYPDGLRGEAIPVEARIITACDSFSAMTTTRSYRKAMSQEEALEELRRCSGSQFDPSVVEALERVVASYA